jgi:hypothetical protein
MKIEDTWTSGGQTYWKVLVDITNGSARSVRDVRVRVDADAIEQSWNMTRQADGFTFSLPAWAVANGGIPPSGGKVSFGYIARGRRPSAAPRAV